MKYAVRIYRWSTGPWHKVRVLDASLTQCGAYIEKYPLRGTWHVTDLDPTKSPRHRKLCGKCFKEEGS